MATAINVHLIAPATGSDALDAVLLRRAREWAAEVGELVDEPAVAPLLVVCADVPRLGEWHRRAALEDLAAGADVAIGPTLDGGFYLLAMTELQPPLLELRGPAAEMLAACSGLGLEVGLLRPERALRTDDDRRALLADPLLPDEVRALL